MFAQQKVTLPRGRHKIIILDEADSMTESAQQALRRTMELYSNTTRFALACNSSEKIIEPIQSRCAMLRYSKLSDAQVLAKVLEVCKKEGVEYTEDGMEAVVFTAQGDMRQALNNLQSTHEGFGLVKSENVFKVGKSNFEKSRFANVDVSLGVRRATSSPRPQHADKVHGGRPGGGLQGAAEPVADGILGRRHHHQHFQVGRIAKLLHPTILVNSKNFNRLSSFSSQGMQDSFDAGVPEAGVHQGNRVPAHAHCPGHLLPPPNGRAGRQALQDQPRVHGQNIVIFSLT